MISNLSVLNVYKKRSKKSDVVTQLLYGDIFRKLEQKGSWLRIKNHKDNYTGYIQSKKFSFLYKSTHKVCVLYSNLYSSPNEKNKTNNKLSFGSRVKITKQKGKFFKFENFWIKKKDLKKNSFKTKNYFKNIEQFINVKYKWGGKHFTGVDCSGLIQLFLNFNNKFCPRDTKDQIKYFKKKIKINNVKKNDLIFWKGHVALIISRKKLIHAYGPLKKVVIMPIKKTIDRIYKTANLKVTGVRRIS